MNHFTAFSLSCLFWALFALAHNAFGQGQTLVDPLYYVGSGGNQQVQFCAGHVKHIMTFGSEDAARIDFDRWAMQEAGVDQKYVELVRELIEKTYKESPDAAFQHCMGTKI